MAVAPIDDPQFLCLVCLDEPHSWTTAGGSLSAPVCAEVLEQTLVYKGVPRAAADVPAEQTAALPADGDSTDGAYPLSVIACGDASSPKGGAFDETGNFSV